MGESLPVTPIRVQMVSFRRPPALESMTTTVIDHTTGAYFRADSDHRTLVGCEAPEDLTEVVDPDSHGLSADDGTIAGLWDRARQRFPDFSAAVCRGGYGALYDMTPDGNPILDRSRTVEGLYWAVGFSGHGFKLSPVVGRMVAELVIYRESREVSSKSVYPVRRCTLCLNNTGSRPERGDTPPMRKESTESRSESRPEWEQLEDWVRSQVQRLIQELLEEEETEFLGRAKSALRSDSDSDTGYRNGYGRARRLTLSSGTIQLRRPRVRDTEEQFESRLLPLFVNRTRKIAELIPELYLHGLSEGDFDLALRGLLGEDAPVSASTVTRLKSKWNDELAQWRSRPLDDLEVVYVWVDGVYVKAGLEKEKAAVLVVMAALSDGSKVVVSTVPGYRESTESWSEVLRDIKRRGLSCPRLVVGDGHLGIWGALRNVYPQAAEQRCWNHKIVNVLAKLPKRQQDQAKLMLRTIPYAPTRTEAERLRTVFTRWCGDHSYEAASEALERDWDRMVTFYDFPKEHWGHLRTTNPVESPFAALRLRTDAAKRYKRVDRAIAVIWKMLMVAEGRFRRLKAPELIEDVYLGAQYADGIAIESTAEMVAA